MKNQLKMTKRVVAVDVSQGRNVFENAFKELVFDVKYTGISLVGCGGEP